MAFLTIFEIFLLVISFLAYVLLHNINPNDDKSPKNWPIVGMLPGIIRNLHKIHGYMTEICEESNMTFVFKGPWFSSINYIITADPANTRYIMVSNFANYPKGDEFKEIFDVLGDGISNTDFELWKSQRKSLHALFSSRLFYKFVVETAITRVEKNLTPILELACEQEAVIDLQDVFSRFTFDSTAMLVSGSDPCFLSTEFPENEFAEALDISEEAIMYRHVKPAILWKLQRWLCVGEEKKTKKAHETLDRVISKYVCEKRSNIMNLGAEDVCLLTSYIKMEKQNGIVKSSDDKFLKDTIKNFLLAGRDTTTSALSWLFWLLYKNPRVIKCIREEIQSKIARTEGWRLFNLEEANSLVYLYGAMCETLRLYPPVPLQHKAAFKPDTLPTGHSIDGKTKILVSIYAMGRMREIWGDDCLEFKPERWITEQGTVRHEPSHKFLTFNAGPRSCLGKEVAFTHMKLVAAAIIHNYDFQLAKGHLVVPSLSITLHMKHGFKVNVSKRSWTN